MKKLLLTIAILSSIIASANNQEKERKQFWKTTFSDGKGLETTGIVISFEEQTNGNIILKECSDTHYQCDNMRKLIKLLNEIPTQEKDMYNKCFKMLDIINISPSTYHK